jgi:predicted nuclease of predicted toxin-antitoxin system
MGRASDAEIMEHAKHEGRTVVTADLDYPRLLVLTGAIEPSLILFRGGDWSDVDVMKRMEDLLRAVSEAEIARSILVVDRNRLRRRRCQSISLEGFLFEFRSHFKQD